MTPRRSVPTASPSGGRLWIIRGILLLFALGLLGIVEGALRLTGFGDPEPLVHRVQQGPLDVYTTNPNLGLRYFPEEMAKIMPKPGFQLFDVEKKPRVVRIFLLGGSTTAGFPYHTHGSLSSFLVHHLIRGLPGQQFEVVNFGMTALNSYAVLDFVEELTAYEPDLFLVYAGHNEFYGALGPASAVAFGRGRGSVQVIRWILELRLTKALARGFKAFRPTPEPIRGKTLMGAMVGRTEIREDDPTFQATMAGYRSNLTKIVEASGGVPVAICDVVSNLRDQRPFGPMFAADLSPSDVDLVAAELSKGIEAVHEGNAPLAVEVLRRAIAADSTHASVHYQLARALDLSDSRDSDLEREQPPRGREWAMAARHYARARDLDGVRFRAPSQVNTIIREVTSESGAWHVPIETVFADRSLGPQPGEDLFLEHLHPRLIATDLMARSVVLTLREKVPWARSWQPVDENLDSVLRTIGVTDLDQEIAERRIFHLTHRWPYPERPEAVFRSDRSAELQNLAQRYLDDEMDLAEAHQRMAEIHAKAGRGLEAYLEMRTACRIFSVVPSRLAASGRLALALGLDNEGMEFLSRAAYLDPDGYRGLLEQAIRARASSESGSETGTDSQSPASR